MGEIIANKFSITNVFLKFIAGLVSAIAIVEIPSYIFSFADQMKHRATTMEYKEYFNYSLGDDWKISKIRNQKPLFTYLLVDACPRDCEVEVDIVYIDADGQEQLFVFKPESKTIDLQFENLNDLLSMEFDRQLSELIGLPFSNDRYINMQLSEYCELSIGGFSPSVAANSINSNTGLKIKDIKTYNLRELFELGNVKEIYINMFTTQHKNTIPNFSSEVRPDCVQRSNQIIDKIEKEIPQEFIKINDRLDG